MYLNKINLGNRSYGISTAAKKYYGKDLKDIQLHEAAMLAGLPQGPNIYDPTKPDNVDRATKRRNIVLTLMNRHGYITKQEMNDAMQIPVIQGLLPSSEVTEMKYQAFIDAVVKEVEKEYPDVNIGSDGLTIHTTLDQMLKITLRKLWMAISLSIQTISSRIICIYGYTVWRSSSNWCWA